MEITQKLYVWPERIAHAIDVRGLTVPVVLHRMGANENYISDLTPTDKKPNPKNPRTDMMLRLAAACECSIEYLYGLRETLGQPPEGVVLLPDPSEFVRSVELSDAELAAAPVTERLPDEQEVLIRVARAKGGGRPELLPFAAGVLRQLEIDPKAAMLFEVATDEMEPSFLKGDWVLVSELGAAPLQPGVHLIKDNDAFLLRRIDRVPGAKPARLDLLRDNPIYPSREFDAGTIKVVGRAVWYGRSIP